jgi:hypothetical protein
MAKQTPGKSPPFLPAADQREYLLRWQRLAPQLEAERHAALRRMSDREYLEIMEQLWSVEVRPARRMSSGLVEWHRMFHK